MINLKIRTEYSFGTAYGRVQPIVDNCKEKHLAITDPNTFGHVRFYDACKKAGINPILGVTVNVVRDVELMEKQPIDEVILLAKNNDGLKDIYRLNTLANQNFYYAPRLGYSDLILSSDNIFIIVPSTARKVIFQYENVYIGLNINNPSQINENILMDFPIEKIIPLGDNYYPTPDDEETYQLFVKKYESKSTPMHIIDEPEIRGLIPNLPDWAIKNTYEIAQQCEVTLPQGGLPVFKTDKTIMDICMEGAKKRSLMSKKAVENGVKEIPEKYVLKPEYMERLKTEIKLIKDKKYEDYFYIISDLVIYAKKHMLVGPSRGSSAGSLVCYLMFITDIDPIAHGLIFERFIDVNRDDLPDIDIDFQDNKRYMVFDYLKEKYGERNVGTIGTVLTMQNRSALTRVAEGLGVPLFEVEDLKNAIVKRSGGDARAGFGILDTFKDLDIGQNIIKKYPGMVHAGFMEGHASHHGKHAAGIVVSENPIDDYCSKTRDDVCQIDKKDAEKINMLKIDALGLRTLSIIQDCLDMIGKDRDWLLNYPLDDKAAWKVLNDKKFSGIFQFEGFALQSLTGQMTVENFNDIVCITSLARPGPLNSGSATQFIKSRIGETKPTYIHELMKPDTQETLGCIIFQEQVMNIARNIGSLSWADVSKLRKAISKSLGEEYINKFWEKFEKGAIKNGLKPKKAKEIWNNICTYGSYGFNKSHAVSYGLISYYCCILKAHYSLEFYYACLRHSSGDEQSVKLLREFSNDGGEFIPFCNIKSETNWSIRNKMLIGGFTNLIGVGEKKAINLIKKLENGDKLTPKQAEMMENPKTPFDQIFEAKEKFSDIYANPLKYKVTSGKVSRIEELFAKGKGEYIFISKLKIKNLRDSNDVNNIQRRGGKKITGPTQYLSCTLEDDTGQIKANIGRFDFEKIGKPLLDVEEDEWLMWKGIIKADFIFVNILKWRLMKDVINAQSQI